MGSENMGFLIKLYHGSMLGLTPVRTIRTHHVRLFQGSYQMCGTCWLQFSASVDIPANKKKKLEEPAKPLDDSSESPPGTTEKALLLKVRLK